MGNRGRDPSAPHRTARGAPPPPLPPTSARGPRGLAGGRAAQGRPGLAPRLPTTSQQQQQQQAGPWPMDREGRAPPHPRTNHTPPTHPSNNVLLSAHPPRRGAPRPPARPRAYAPSSRSAKRRGPAFSF
ncbi:hypothetical protein Rsub_08234 [Raphidocelis subcapitata]|uniref:Uncharacterized protein n=1 Tax=Raphidocelis subcapitata TaxID=307507 RepID=A0A2V0P7F7_9CHLO|nr:hypothetical protein Rsub_08234 [Raphidocelis subcapitata]|eukprot:GBF95798.1 hypothetical protein Rsub_08234 [Raphidocelis subcapitata]